MEILYKILFEIKVLHEFFLTRSDGTSIFELDLQQQRLDYLQEEFSSGRDPVNTSIGFSFPEGLQEFYEGLNLRIFHSYSGCRVAVRVRRIFPGGQAELYEPYATLPENLLILVQLSRKGLPIDTITNSRIQRPLPSTYFFS